MYGEYLKKALCQLIHILNESVSVSAVLKESVFFLWHYVDLSRFCTILNLAQLGS